MRPLLLLLWFAVVPVVFCTEKGLEEHLSRAREAQAHGDFVNAAREWQAVVNLQPTVAEAHSNLGIMWHFAGNYEKSIPTFLTAAKLNPVLAAPHLFLGIDYYLTSRFDNAIPQLQAALRIEPNNRIAEKWLGMTYFETGKFSQAVLFLSRLTQDDSSDSDAQFHLSRACSKLLFQSYEEVRSINAHSAYLTPLRATPDAEAKTPATPLETLIESVNSKPTEEGWYQVGMAAKARALAALDSFFAANRDSYRAHQLKAEYARASGDDQAAITEYREALAINLKALQLHLGIANILTAQHNLRGAVEEYESELALDPYSNAALQRIAQAHADLHEPQKAEPYLNRALAIRPENAKASQIMGKVKVETGDFKSAISYLQKAIAGGVDDRSALFQLSKAYRGLGDNAQADLWLARFRQRLSTDQQKNRLSSGESTRVSSEAN